ncbi:MAG: glycosyltransferase [Candidatus Korarchaeota archaeon NZ13-K]|nr:MAG: glycosyltransferase [Candidatus Korarchaeota archaeon NZ13-K]
MASDATRMYAMVFGAYRPARIAYLVASGPVNTAFHNPELYDAYTIVANSEFSKRNLEDSGFRVDGYIHHAVDLHIMDRAGRSPYPFDRPKDRFTWFVYTANIGPRKGVESFLEAFRMAQKRTDYSIGLRAISNLDGHLKPEDRYIINHAGFGTLEYGQVMRFIAGGDYYLHLVKNESFGLPALEARALGRPLVALRMPPTVEFIPEAGAFWVPVSEVRRVRTYGVMDILSHEYDVAQAADLIVQAHDVRWNYPSQYEDMRARLLEGIEEYHYSKLYRLFADMVAEASEGG